MVVAVSVERVSGLSGLTWGYAAHVMLGENIKGIAHLVADAAPGDKVQCQVLQIDHEAKRVALMESGTERTVPASPA
jgi:hypothetical protein